MESRLFSPLFVGLALLGLSSCTSRDDADRAISEAETAITAQHADAIRYAPDSFATIMTIYSSARASRDSGDYREAMQRAGEAADRARALPPAIAAGREALRPQWTELHGNVSLMISSLERRLGELEQGRRPAGMTVAKVTEARSVLDSLKTGLQRAAAAWDGGNQADAVHAAERLQPRGVAALELVGVRMSPHGAQ
jgi:hypothetical protein